MSTPDRVYRDPTDCPLTQLRRIVLVPTCRDSFPQKIESPDTPGGFNKASRYGREMGWMGLEEFTQLKTVQIRTGKRTGTFGLRES